MINIQICKEAKKNVDAGAWNYLVGGAESEMALRRNRHAFQQWSFAPQGLKDVSQINTNVAYMGINFRLPVIAAPIGGITLFHEEGDFEWARGLSQADIVGTVSGVARVEFDKIITETLTPLLYQLYFFGDDVWVKDRLKQAESCGYKAVVVTMDTKYFGFRERDLLANYDSRTAGWRTVPQPPDRDRNLMLTIQEIEKIKTYTSLPVIVKGIISAHDIHELSKIGVDGIWISNHGGRQLDHVAGSLTYLSSLAPLCREHSMVVIFDGGVRRGGDVVLAHLLGADLVAAGRLPIYGLIQGGAAGIKKVFANLEQEIIHTMGLIGLLNFNLSADERQNFIQPESMTGLFNIWDELED